VLVDYPRICCHLQVDFEQLQHRIGSCIYCASTCNSAARNTVQATLQQCCNTEVAAHPTQVLPHGFALPRGSTMEAVLWHIEELPARLLLAEARADGASRSAASAASEALIIALRQCDLLMYANLCN
jgi:hypothetical protein